MAVSAACDSRPAATPPTHNTVPSLCSNKLLNQVLKPPLILDFAGVSRRHEDQCDHTKVGGDQNHGEKISMNIERRHVERLQILQALLV